MVDDSGIDPLTGLLHRAAFLQEVRDGQSKVPSQVRRGCLLILHFPILQSIAEQGGNDAATIALRNLLAVVETRLRSRDTLGRIGEHSLCVLLRQCREKDAVIIAEQYVALLRDVIIDTGSQSAPMELRYRIVPLDSLGRRPRQGVSRSVKEPELADNNHLIGGGYTPAEEIETEPGKVVSINAAREKQKDLNLANERTSTIGSELGSDAVLPRAIGQNTKQSFAAWRLKPGLLLNNKPLVCCYRVQLVGAENDLSLLQTNSMFQRVLNALSLDESAARPAVESQLIMPVQVNQLDMDAPGWLKNECTTQRVAPSDICLSMTLDSLSKDLRASVPILRLLNRLGIRLMLEGVTSASQFRALQNLAGFDYLYISARVLQESLNQIRQRQELVGLIAEARVQDREICAAGVDTKVLLAHAKQLGVEIGFGRECGKSLAFPETLDSQK
jgi:GGDEF domain-containing protein/EAL domain-containing protein (putative c-di-GMP-specific phosphodiesterase class I)